MAATSIAPAPTKLTPPDIVRMKQLRRRVVMLTAYDAPSARLAEGADTDVLLVGDSAAMTVLGYASTVSATMAEMLMLTRAVSRGVTRALVIADMPFGSYQVSDAQAVRNAVRFIKRGGADAVKIEGGAPSVQSRVRALVDAGIAVAGHIGLTPQSAMALGGFKPQGLTVRAADRLLHEALALERAGCFALVLEAIPPPVAARITSSIGIPTIGIGAGTDCDGQVLVWHDVLGLSSGRIPRFVKKYADVGACMMEALKAFAADVREGRFPAAEHTYAMSKLELEQFRGASVEPQARACATDTPGTRVVDPSNLREHVRARTQESR